MNGSGKLRGFASKLRDQAKDAVGNMKLPSFDDMAQKDEYIHSPDFNVRGQKRQQQQQEEGILVRAETHSSSTSLNGTATVDEASNYSTESSWSLLDRPSGLTTALVAGRKVAATTTTIQQTRVAERTIERTIPSTPSETDRQSATKSTVSLLSVVSDALQPITPVQTNSNRWNQRAADSNDDDSDESSQDFDEEDPILSMLRKNKNNNEKGNQHPNDSNDAPASVITIQKSSNRFMDDVRLQTPAKEYQGFDGIIQEKSTTTTTTTTTTTNTEHDKGRGPLGGFFKTTAMQKFQRMILRNGSDTAATRQTAPPPLSRARPTKTQPEEDEDDFRIEASTSVGILGVDELERLNQLKLAEKSSFICSSLSSIPMLVEYLGDHKHTLFVLFTLVLCVYVYFRKASF